MNLAAQITAHITTTSCLLEAAAGVTPESKRLLVASEIRAAIRRLEGALAMVAESTDPLHAQLARAERDADIIEQDRTLRLLEARSIAELGVCSREGQ